jgi:phage tail-like protein
VASSATRNDPLGAFNFYITLLDSSSLLGTLVTAVLGYAVAGFSECTGLEASVEIMDYREGGLNTYVHKFATRASYANLVLKRGVIYLYDDLWNWHNGWVQGSGTRKDGLVVLLDESRQPAKIWKFKRGIPMKWVGPSLNASQSSVAFESLDIAHEGLELELGA